jgi:hypothetical protein
MSERPRTRAPRPAPGGPSATPLVRKLAIKPDHQVVLLDVPDWLPGALAPLPPGATLRSRLRAQADVIVICCAERATLRRRLPALVRALAFDGGLWIAWPKRTSGVATDLSDAAVRELGLAAGLVDNKVCAIDEVYSALRFVYRLSDRPATAARVTR